MRPGLETWAGTNPKDTLGTHHIVQARWRILHQRYGPFCRMLGQYSVGLGVCISQHVLKHVFLWRGASWSFCAVLVVREAMMLKGL